MIEINKVNFAKGDGLVPAIIQDGETSNVLMLGYMNKVSLGLTISTKQVTFWSRTKKRIWKKGEESGNVLNVLSIDLDCDQDTLLIKVKPSGPTCHKGTDTCWSKENRFNALTLESLENTIQDRLQNASDTSYTSTLFNKGINTVAQKVGEEAVELIIEAKDDNKVLFLNEAADLMYHYIVLLAAKGFRLKDVVNVLKGREK